MRRKYYCVLCLMCSFIFFHLLFNDFKLNKIVPYIQDGTMKYINSNKILHKKNETPNVTNDLQNVTNNKKELSNSSPNQVTNITKFIIKTKLKSEKLVDLDDFIFKFNCPVCKNAQAPVVIAVIFSAPNNFQKRQAIRNTWGKPTDYLKHVFLFGETTEELSKNLLAEHQRYGDIVQGNFIDTYRNLTYKHIMGIKWASQYCPTAKFILKSDDDVFVHVYELKELVDKRLSREKDLISCMINRNAPVFRNKDSKWYASEQEFADNFYPAYCSGSLIVYSPKVADQLIAAAENERYFYIDDVYVTGILTSKLNISLTEIGDLYLSAKRKDVVFKKGIKTAGKFLFGPINLDVYNIMRLWNATEEYKKLQELH